MPVSALNNPAGSGRRPARREGVTARLRPQAGPVQREDGAAGAASAAVPAAPSARATRYAALAAVSALASAASGAGAVSGAAVASW